MPALHSLIIIFNYNFSQLCQLSPSPPKSQLSRSQQSRHWTKFSLPSISHLFVLQKGGISSLEFVEEAEMQKPKFAKAAALNLPNLKMGFINLDCLGNLVDWSSCHPQERLTWCYGTYICISAPCPTLQRMLRQMEEMEAIRSLHGHTRPMGWNWAEEKLNLVSAKWRSQCVHNIFASQKQPPSVSVCN